MPPATEGIRQLAIAGQAIHYRLKRSARRTFGLSVGREGLTVAAPQRASLRDIETLLHRHGRWIIGKLDDWASRQQKAVPPIADGMLIFVLGDALTVRIDADLTRGHHINRAQGEFILNSRQTPRQALIDALKREARPILAERLKTWAEVMGLPCPPLRLSSAKTRWGSCNHRGQISLNWRLIQMPAALIDYVVIHELAHLREMNHGPAFWSIVAAFCPDWKTRRQALKTWASQQHPELMENS